MKKDILQQMRTAVEKGTVIDDAGAISGLCGWNPVYDAGKLPDLAVRPADINELQGIVQRANESGINLTISSSRGLRSRNGTAAREDSVLIDLSQWKNIDIIDRRNRVCIIGPGVTFGELVSALAERGMTLPVPMGPRDGKSVLASIMDREPSTWPAAQWDAADPAASTEFIFGSGELFRTGAAGGPGTLEQQRASGGAQKSPLGPSQGDFHRVVQGSQGTMGIFTWIAVRCEIKPVMMKTFLVGADDPGIIIPFLYDIMSHGLGEQVFLINRTAALLLAGLDPGTPSNPALPRYICIQNICGFERLPRERVKYQEKDSRTLAAGRGLKLVDQAAGISGASLLEAAARTSGENGWRDRLGGRSLSVFFITTLDRINEFTNIFMRLASGIGIAEDTTGVYIQPVVQGHACHVEFIIPFDPVKQDLDALRRLEREAVQQLAAAGAFFSRPYGAAQETELSRNPAGYELLGKVKRIFDPNRVLNRGKWGL